MGRRQMDIKQKSSLLFLALALAGCGGGQDAAGIKGDERPAADVRIGAVGESRVAGTYEAIGSVRSKVSSVISSKVMGHVTGVRFNEGDRVRKGQLLIEIDDRDAQNRLAQARAGLAEAESAREEVERSIGAARSARAAAEAQAALTETTYKRFQELLKKNSVSRQEFDEIQARHTAARAEAQRAAEMLGAVESKRSQVEARIKQARIALEYAELYAGYFTIQAPFSGVVTAKQVELGQLASPGLPLLTLEDPNSYRLEALVEESRIRNIREGDTVRVQIDAVGYSFEGKVDKIFPFVDPSSRSVTVRITLPGSSDIKSGMYGRAWFPSGERSVITVPTSSLVRKGQLVGVFIVDGDSRARFRLVKPGRIIGDRTEVLSGLEEGEKLVLDPGVEISDGRRVRSRTAAINAVPDAVDAGVNS